MSSVLSVKLIAMSAPIKAPSCDGKQEEVTVTPKRKDVPEPPKPKDVPELRTPSNVSEDKDSQYERLKVPEICITPPEKVSIVNKSFDGSFLDTSLPDDCSCTCEQHCCSPSGVAQLVVPTYSGETYPDFQVSTLKPWQCARSRQQRRSNCRRMKLINKCGAKCDPMV